MNNLINVWVVDGKQKTYNLRKELGAAGFKYSSEPVPHWFKDVPNEELSILKEWCFKKRLALVFSDNTRSIDYRECFFESKRSLFLSNKYFCSYCGRLLSKDKVCVDHLISIKKSQTSRFYSKVVQKLGYNNINDVRNLVPSCKRCNSRKGAKAGLWVLKGALGRHPWFWIVIWGLWFITFSWAFYVLLKGLFAFVNSF